MKQITILLLILITSTIFAQSADDLNEQSKEFLQTRKFDKAIPLLKRASELGNAEAQYNLGYCYQTGSSVEQDNKKAIEWYTKSAEQGYNDGLYQMMMAYGNGIGVEQDFEKAFQYGLKCANNGDGTCMWNVVNCYNEGMGVEKNVDKMIEWATKLGKLENPENLTKSGYITSARLQLAQLYQDGTNIKQDNFKSYLWYIIYNECKRDFSYLQQQQIVKEIQELEEKLTAEQKANTQKEAKKILGRRLINMKNLYIAEM